MDIVVWIAIGTLGFVFLLALAVLLALCWRRRQLDETQERAESTFILKKNRDDKVDKLVELVPLLDGELVKCDWAEGAESPFKDVVAILKLTAEIVKILSEVGINKTSTKIYDVIAQAMYRVDTHFHELLEFTPEKEGDVRVIEARALTLTTTVWSLNAAFTLHGFDKAKEVEEKVIKMYEHVDALRQLIPGYEGRTEDNEEAIGEKEGSQSTDETNVDTPVDAPLSALVEHEDLPVHSGANTPSHPSIQVDAVVHAVPVEEEDEEVNTAENVALLSKEKERGEGVNAAAATPPHDSPSKSMSIYTPSSNGSPPQPEGDTKQTAMKEKTGEDWPSSATPNS